MEFTPYLVPTPYLPYSNFLLTTLNTARLQGRRAAVCRKLRSFSCGDKGLRRDPAHPYLLPLNETTRTSLQPECSSHQATGHRHARARPVLSSLLSTAGRKREDIGLWLVDLGNAIEKEAKMLVPSVRIGMLRPSWRCLARPAPASGLSDLTPQPPPAPSHTPAALVSRLPHKCQTKARFGVSSLRCNLRFL